VGLLSVTEAEALVLEHATMSAVESIDIRDASGRILAQAVHADRDYPPIHRATMDGIAVSATAARSWTIERTIAAGEPARALDDTERGCVRIMTGAELPANANTVIPIEDVAIHDTMARLHDGVAVAHGQHVHRKGIDRQQGDAVLPAGTRLDAPRIAILAACGYARISVATMPRVSVLSTGNEIVPVATEKIEPHQSRMSNLEGIRAGLAIIGIHEVQALHLADDEREIRSGIARAIRESGLLILTGGMSKGQFDYGPEALESCGVSKIFHGVAQKPGKPFWFGKSERCVVFGLPGNPVSTLTVFLRYLVPFFEKSAGAKPMVPLSVPLGSGFASHASLTLFTPARLTCSPAGRILAEPVEYHGSGDLTALATSNGFVEIPAGSSAALTDRCFPFYSWI